MALVYAACAAAAIGGALSGASPTGWDPADLVWSAGFAVVVTLAASKARRWAWLVMAGTAAAVTEGWLASGLGTAALVVALFAVVLGRRSRPLGALTGLLAVQALLRLDLAEPHGLATVVAAAATIPVLVSGYRRSSSRTRRRVRGALAVAVVVGVVATGVLAVMTLASQREVRDAIREARLGLDAARNGDEAGAVQALLDAHETFDAAQDRLGGPWVLPARTVPVVGQHARALDDLSGEGANLAQLAAQAADQADIDRLEFRDGVIDLELVANFEEPLADSAAGLEQASDAVSVVDSPWLLPPLSSEVEDFSDEVDEAIPDAEVAMQGVQLAPALFGGDGDRRYLVVFTTPAEMRGLGGFIGNYAELTAVDGDVEMTRSGRIQELRPPSGQEWQLSGPDDYLARWGRFNPDFHVQDVTFSPDMPSVAHVLEEIYPQTFGGSPIDGVIVVDPLALAALMEFTGPIPVTGLDQPLTSQNAAQILLREQYLTFDQREDRVDFLDEATRETFNRLTEGDIPGPRRVVDVLGPMVHQGRLMLHSVHEDEQDFYESVDLDGALPAPGPEDFLAVTAQNSGNNKIDTFLERSISYDVGYDPSTGAVEATATVVLRNTAPAGGLPEVIIGNSRGLPPGTNRMHLSIYSPHAAREATINGEPWLMEQQQELGRRTYSGFLSVPPGGETTVVLRLSGAVPTGGEYRLQLAPQPMVNPDELAVTLHLPDGWRADGSPDFEVTGDGAATGVTLSDDDVLSVPVSRR